MNVQGRKRRRGTAALLGVLLAWTGSVVAQNPPSSSPPNEVEIYYGVRRVLPAPKKVDVPPADAPSEKANGDAAPGVFVPMHSGNWVDAPSGSAPAVPPLPPPDHPPVDSGIAPVRFNSTAQPAGHDTPVLLPPPPSMSSQPLPLPPVNEEEVKPLAPASPPNPEKPPQVVERVVTERAWRHADDSRTVFGPFTGSHILAILAGSVWCFLAVFVSSYFLHRRLSAALKKPFRVELMLPAGQSLVGTPVLAQPSAPAAARAGDEDQVDEDEKPGGEPFDLGPSFEEERDRLAQAARRQEAALLQHICDENVKLNDEISRQQAKEASPSGPKPTQSAAVDKS